MVVISNLILILLLNVLLSTSLQNSQSPGLSSLNSQTHKWVNPCRLHNYLNGHSNLNNGWPTIPVEELLHNVMSRARTARNHGQQIKEVFLNNTFNDPEFEIMVKAYREEWLPLIPESSKKVFCKMTAEQSLLMAFEMIQYFAVGFEQILVDQVLYTGIMINEFKEIEYDLFQLLCEIQIGIHIQNIKTKPEVLEQVMSNQYRVINQSSLRNLRDFLILRDYINATNFITHMFAYHKSKVKSNHKFNNKMYFPGLLILMYNMLIVFLCFYFLKTFLIYDLNYI